MPAAKVETLLPAEGGLEVVQAPSHEVSVEAYHIARRERGDRVVSVVEAADRKADFCAGNRHREAVESVERDLSCGDAGDGAGEVAVGAAVHAVVAQVDGRESEAGSAPRAGARIGRMRQLPAGDARVLEAEPHRLPLQAQADLRDPWIICVEDRLSALG